MADIADPSTVTPSNHDVMNDPAFDATSRGDGDGDTCRICRSEGTPEEPLFHPCKCSGSIKHVHQDCLMEWLSHTNKKHCELCKTSFRFTKLYDADMPDKLPLGVFVTRACIHIAKYCLTWLRAILVVFIWLILLPWWIRRWAWRGLFFMMDAGWAREPWITKMALEHRDRAMLGTNLHNATSKVPYAITPESGLGPIYANLVLGIWNVIAGPWKSHKSPESLPQDALLHATFKASTSTLLSDLDFANNLTDSPLVNRAVLDLMEGQIITIVVVVAFILVFLIREWVIQQQPILHAAAHVRQAEQQLHRIEAAREGIREEIRTIEEQLQYLRENRLPPSPSADEGQDSTNQTQGIAGDIAADPNMLHYIDWPYFERRVKEISDHRTSEHLQRSPEDVAIIRTLTEEMIAIIKKYRNNETSSSETFNDMVEWVRRIPSEIDAAWLADVSALYHEIRPRVENNTVDDSEAPGSSSQVLPSSAPTTPNVPEYPHDEDGELANPYEHSSPEVQDTSLEYSASKDSFASSESTGWQELSSTAELPLGTSDDRETDPVDKGKAPAEEPQEGGVQENEDEDRAAISGSSSDVCTTTDREGIQPGEALPVESTTSSAPDDPHVAPVRSPSSESVQTSQREQLKSGILDNIYDYFWGDIDTAPLVLEAARLDNINANIADAPVVEIVDLGAARDAADGEDQAEVQVQDPEVAAAAAEAGLNAEAIEDAEDLEGVLELIGMQGPIAVLFQTALFCGLLVTITLWGAVGAPYLFGKLALQILGDPVLFFVIIPLRTIAGIGDFVLDIFIFLGGALGFGVVLLGYQLQMFLNGQMEPAPMTDTLSMLEAAVVSSSERSAAYLSLILSAGTTSSGTDSYFLLASLQAHHSLNALKSTISGIINWIFAEVQHTFLAPRSDVLARAWSLIRSLATWLYSDVYGDFTTVTGLLSQIKEGKIFALTIRQAEPIELDPILSYWSGSDRAITILIGYSFLALVSISFVLRDEPIFTTPALQKIEKSLSDMLKQAGGVVKVILIISIEMLLFPLYCGMLLDVALLPLFEGVTLASRIEYANNRPYMFAFLHWFLGTAYMFNFALFVSMCRRILRSGVLYFIRDPDDPTFHPVRDVLERSISTQLRKIAFSALVYGLMVTLCLGGIVWGVAGCNQLVFPLRWSTPDPVLEFPLEFLFYNFISPLLFKLFQPSLGLEATYEWWLRKCAKRLRLSHFLFGERNENEEHKTVDKSGDKVTTILDGSYVKVPASDQVRVQRGHAVFVPVTEADVIEGEAEQECSLHGRPNQRHRCVYIPPYFRVRIGLFLGGLWMLCAAIGVGFTIVPLLLGRGLCALVLPPALQLSDIWAYSVGMHALLLTTFVLFRGKKVATSAIAKLSGARTIISDKALHIAHCTLKSVYVYGFAVVVAPTLATLLIHFYFIVPSRTYLSSSIPPEEPPTTSFNPNNLTSLFSSSSGLLDSTPRPNTNDGPLPLHHIYILPDWTLGFVIARFITILDQLCSWTLPAAIYRQITLAGRLNPNVRVATRAFILPYSIICTILLLTPLLFAGAIVHVLLPLTLPAGVEVDVTAKTKIYRYAYPIVLGHALAIWGTFAARKGVKKWKERIKDEVYSVGERLHNFGERRPPEGSKGFMKKGKEREVDEVVEGGVVEGPAIVEPVLERPVTGLDEQRGGVAEIGFAGG
ncbi:ERAD-associated E3 ubiquitin-protein ligase doa10 [Sphaceloma murrayae]|uniref:RING-type E3 ubiquitin transferase n=1 Tax=Sphaceloma murrayae TaxID=2082308 RepID=A0A2K1QS82_9PEZI|nr:ERAD-associated E3 ubiquitin-protein ligase doa10 [Sphaceloma murrayae]